MAHPPDPALARAVGEAIKQLRYEGWSTRALAERFDVADSTVTRWENGGRAPEMKHLPVIDELCGKPRGHILRLAGFIDDESPDVEAAVNADESLTDPDREALLFVYRFFRSRALAEAKVSAVGTATTK